MDLKPKSTPHNGQALAALALVVALMQRLEADRKLAPADIEAILSAATELCGPAIGMASVDAHDIIARVRGSF